ncbi:MAG: DUF5668 domain-containing protein [Patescibacteria group bacterium]|nr:DUF5668 domain-containing protein [Patescibacteria group bacterium]
MMDKNQISLQPQESESDKKDQKRERHLKYRFKRSLHIDFGRLAFGLFLTAMGIYLLAKNTGFLPAKFVVDINILQLWPLLIIFMGLSMLSAKSKLSALIGGIITFVVLFVIGYLIMSHSDALKKYSRPVKTTPFVIQEKSRTTRELDVSLKTNGTTVSVYEDPSALIKGSLTSNLTDLVINTSTKGIRQIISLQTHRVFDKLPMKYANKLDIGINKNTPLRFNLRGKTMNANLDFSDLQIQNADLVIDASNIKMKIGNKPENIFMKISVRTSRLSIVVPRSVGIQVATASELSLQNFEGLSKIQQQGQEEKIYRTEKFDVSRSKIFIDLDASFSNVNIERIGK